MSTKARTSSQINFHFKLHVTIRVGIKTFSLLFFVSNSIPPLEGESKRTPYYTATRIYPHVTRSKTKNTI